jgi:hypothetical protein
VAVVSEYVEQEAAAIRAKRAELRAAEAALARRTRVLIDEHLTDATVREIAALVGLSLQRIGQLRPGRRARQARPAVEPVGPVHGPDEEVDVFDTWPQQGRGVYW